MCRPVHRSIFVFLVACTLAACSDDDWCESRSAQMLRERTAPVGPYRTVHDLLNAGPDSPVAIFAHRGGNHCEEMDGAPENSLPNLEKAIRMGFDGFETDLWMTSDGEFIIHHDETLDRTTTGTGKVTSITSEEARQLNLKYPSGAVSTEKIPTLRELLTAGRGRTIFLIDLKGGSAERFPELLQIARETGAIDHVFYWIDWSEEYAAQFEQYIQAGMGEARTNVIWRARHMDALTGIIERLDPIIVDIPPLQEELNKQRGYTDWLPGILPKTHLALVRKAREHGVKVLVSQIITNSYLRGLRSEGVLAFMSRAPEVQLSYVIKKEWHH